jgi:hypothetical protein
MPLSLVVNEYGTVDRVKAVLVLPPALLVVLPVSPNDAKLAPGLGPPAFDVEAVDDAA